MGVTDSPLSDRVLFVEGSPRSGTSWLAVLLATHPEIAGTATESHLFDQGLAGLFDSYEATGPAASLAAYATRDEFVDLVRDFCDGVLLRMRARLKPQAPFVVEKTPLAVSPRTVMVRKLEIYPDGWYLHVVREREAVVRSLMRAPFMIDKSRKACETLWEESVAAIRELAGGRARYLELAYEELRDDPAGGGRIIFDWLGVDGSQDVLDIVAQLSEERYAELPQRHTPAAAHAGSRTALTAAARVAAARARALVRGVGTRGGQGVDGEPPRWKLVFDLVSAAGHGDAEAARDLTTDGFVLELRTGAGDLRASGDEGRDALAALAAGLFERDLVSISWNASEGDRFSTVMFGGLRGDASRVDLFFHGVPDGERIEHLIAVAPGDPRGRVRRTWSPA